MNLSKRMLVTGLLTLTALPYAPGFADEAPAPAANPAAEARPESRLRMFGQNGTMVVLFRDSSCNKGFWSSEGEKASGGFGSAFGSFIGKVSNTSLGIAETDTSRYLSAKDGMLSKAYFREYVIPANKPTTLSMRYQDITTFYHGPGISYTYTPPSCSGAIAFTPEAGEDYEAGFRWDEKTCFLSVNHVVTKDGKTELVPVPVRLAVHRTAGHSSFETDA
jgi:hypothetical protein